MLRRIHAGFRQCLTEDFGCRGEEKTPIIQLADPKRAVTGTPTSNRRWIAMRSPLPTPSPPTARC